MEHEKFLSSSCISASLAFATAFRSVLVCCREEYHDTVDSGTVNLDLRNRGDNWFVCMLVGCPPYHEIVLLDMVLRREIHSW